MFNFTEIPWGPNVYFPDFSLNYFTFIKFPDFPWHFTTFFKFPDFPDLEFYLLFSWFSRSVGTLEGPPLSGERPVPKSLQQSKVRFIFED